jgi:hypothetical protein
MLGLLVRRPIAGADSPGPWVLITTVTIDARDSGLTKAAFGLTSATCFCVTKAEAEPNDPICDLIFPPRPAFASRNLAAENELLLLR